MPVIYFSKRERIIKKNEQNKAVDEMEREKNSRIRENYLYAIQYSLWW